MSARPAQNANCRQQSHALKKALLEKDKAFYPEYRSEKILIQGDNTQTTLQDSNHPQLQKDLGFKFKKIAAEKRQINPQNGDQNQLENNQEEGLFLDLISQFEALLTVWIEQMKQKYCLQSSKIAHLKEKLKTKIPELIQHKCNQCIQFAGMNFYLNEEQSSFNLNTQKSKPSKKSIESFIKDQLQIKNQISESRAKQEQDQVRRQQGEATIQVYLNHSSISEIQKVSYLRSSFSGVVLGRSPENDEVSTESRDSMESIVEIQERHEWALKNRGVQMVEPNFSQIIRECKDQYSFLIRPPES